jgi:hypothetical protein
VTVRRWNVLIMRRAAWVVAFIGSAIAVGYIAATIVSP